MICNLLRWATFSVKKDAFIKTSANPKEGGRQQIQEEQEQKCYNTPESLIKANSNFFFFTANFFLMLLK